MTDEAVSLIDRKRIDALLRSANRALPTARRTLALSGTREDHLTRLLSLVKQWRQQSSKVHGPITPAREYEKHLRAVQRTADIQRLIRESAAWADPDSAFLSAWLTRLGATADAIVQILTPHPYIGPAQHTNGHLEPARARIESLTRAPGAPPLMASHSSSPEGSSMHAAA